MEDETFIVAMVLAILLLCGLLLMFCSRKKEQINEVDSGIEAFQSSLFNSDEDDQSLGSAAHRGIGTKYQRFVVNKMRSELGVITHNTANRLVAQKTALKIMANDEDMRTAHISYHLPIIVSLYFIPTDSDIISNQIDKSYAKECRVRAVNSGRSVK